jgi:hypothetical protein
MYHQGKKQDVCSNCYRTTAKDHPYRQTYFTVVPGVINKEGNLACNYHLPVEK